MDDLIFNTIEQNYANRVLYVDQDVFYRDENIYKITDLASRNYEIFLLNRTDAIFTGHSHDPVNIVNEHFKLIRSKIDDVLDRWELAKEMIIDMGLIYKKINIPSLKDFMGIDIYYKDHSLYFLDIRDIHGSVKFFRSTVILKEQCEVLKIEEAIEKIRKEFIEDGGKKIIDGEDIYGE